MANINEVTLSRPNESFLAEPKSLLALPAFDAARQTYYRRLNSSS